MQISKVRLGIDNCAGMQTTDKHDIVRLLKWGGNFMVTDVYA